ncbi:hypothetical protein GCM10009588_10340 [Microbacterium phyllosphaerae]
MSGSLDHVGAGEARAQVRRRQTRVVQGGERRPLGIAAEVGRPAREPTGEQQQHREHDAAEHAEHRCENDVGHALSLGTRRSATTAPQQQRAPGLRS